MVKTITPQLKTHIAGEATTVCTCWRIIRKDGVVKAFTDLDSDLTFEGVVYKTSGGYQRTSVVNTITLAVDDLNIKSILGVEGVEINDIRNGLYNNAKVFLFLVNYTDLSQGKLTLRRGTIGEVSIDQSGIITTELRGMLQPFKKNYGSVIQTECRVEFGSPKCGVLLEAKKIAKYGDVFLIDEVFGVPVLAPVDRGPNLFVYAPLTEDVSLKSVYTGTTTDTNGYQFVNVPSLFGSKAITTPFSSNAFIKFDPGVTPSAQTFPFTINLWVTPFAGFDDPGVRLLVRTLIPYCDIKMNGSNLEVYFTDYYIPDIVYNPNMVVGNWYNIQVSKSGTDVLKLFVNGVLVGTKLGADEPDAPNALSSSIKLYAKSFGVQELFWINGHELHSSNFTPPTTALQPIQIENYEDYTGNRLYKVDFQSILNQSGTQNYTTNTGSLALDANGGAAVILRGKSMPGVVVSSSDKATFVLSFPDPLDGLETGDDWFKLGTCEFISGLNKGKRIEISNWVASSKTITTFLPFNYVISPGDKVILKPGCNKTREHCINKFNNFLNFRGDPFVKNPKEIKT